MKERSEIQWIIGLGLITQRDLSSGVVDGRPNVPPLQVKLGHFPKADCEGPLHGNPDCIRCTYTQPPIHIVFVSCCWIISFLEGPLTQKTDIDIQLAYYWHNNTMFNTQIVARYLSPLQKEDANYLKLLILIAVVRVIFFYLCNRILNWPRLSLYTLPAAWYTIYSFTR